MTARSKKLRLTLPVTFRLKGHGKRVRVPISDWTRAGMGGVVECQHAILAWEKALGQSIRGAREAGHSWGEVGLALGVTETAASFDDVADAFAAHKRRLWWVFWSDMSEPGAHS